MKSKDKRNKKQRVPGHKACDSMPLAGVCCMPERAISTWRHTANLLTEGIYGNYAVYILA